MILTGKAKEDFENYVLNKNLGHDSEVLISVYNQETLFINYNNVKETLLNALIIEWFDSVGIYISVKRLCTSLKFRCWYFVITNEDGDYLNKHGADESRINNDSRIEITIKAIKKANEIYNSK